MKHSSLQSESIYNNLCPDEVCIPAPGGGQSDGVTHLADPGPGAEGVNHSCRGDTIVIIIIHYKVVKAWISVAFLLYYDRHFNTL